MNQILLKDLSGLQTSVASKLFAKKQFVYKVNNSSPVSPVKIEITTSEEININNIEDFYENLNDKLFRSIGGDEIIHNLSIENVKQTGSNLWFQYFTGTVDGDKVKVRVLKKYLN